MKVSKPQVFQFKQFEVDQTNCGMKINTDGVLLGALLKPDYPETILDIGTGTGVIALMLAQRFPAAKVVAVEIDAHAAETASANFRSSPFADRLSLHAGSFQDYLRTGSPVKYDLIVSNPPFFLNSIKNANLRKQTARHTDHNFFSDLLSLTADSLNANGNLSLILPLATVQIAAVNAREAGLFLLNEIEVSSFPSSVPHRKIVTFGLSNSKEASTTSFAIYEREKRYSEQYKEALKDFFTIF
ncbi:tRNA1(Val) (adenine(37)-N6)-methyltransferase [Arcticibacter tournemirensis]|uniref:tRNA1(Val) (adenine(37)-N6)-methyltransferase n=1 Tax=Arcticibacter tournemirensis TaxID=699437 RepID=A0A4Q0M737_9SPHI|nr:methyltransferase [Arcticibacter tournemirensis]RXF68824.1 methyltransferase domain-containing protein [Arcticibacter tournemirensis]